MITCGDEGVQINEGTRFGVLGAGVELEGGEVVLKHLKSLYGDDISLASSGQDDWIKKAFKLDEWDQVDATFQQQLEALSDKTEVPYAGFLGFNDPRKLKHNIKGHMVRPKGVHIGNGVSLTLGGGEQTFHLGRFVISCEWAHLEKPAFVKDFVGTQIAFYASLVGKKTLDITIEEEGKLPDEVKKKNKVVLKKAGFVG